MKIRLVMLGKTRRDEFRSLLDEYVHRISNYAVIAVNEMRDSSPVSFQKLKIDSASTVVLLDAGGKQLTSAQFARWVANLRDRGTREMVFLCGDADGFPDELRAKARQKVSLSTLTMPHDFARVVLAEQIYRAFTILHGHPYSK
jgi:23S rRNA (pseudouridine1915-N3)-methyltransferase